MRFRHSWGCAFAAHRGPQARFSGQPDYIERNASDCGPQLWMAVGQSVPAFVCRGKLG